MSLARYLAKLGALLDSDGKVTASALAAGAVSNAYIGGKGQVFTSSGTFTVPADVTAVKVTVVGGGGNGATVTAGAGGGGGGGGGAVAIKFITGLTPAGTVAVTVGGVAGTSSFGAYCSATGGATAATVTTNTGGAGGAGGTATGGDINLSGGAGGNGGFFSCNNWGCGASGASANSYGRKPFVDASGLGGNEPSVSSAFGNGGGGTAINTSVNGSAASGYGSGGGGACTNNATDRTGGAGTGGIVIVEW